MATADQIRDVRNKSDEMTSEVYTDVDISYMIDQADGDTLAAAAQVWEQKAARYAGLVDISESGSSRSMSQLYKNALAMQAAFEKRVLAASPTTTDAVAAPRSRAATRL